ncbi:MAG: hypothetical protein ACYTGH_12110 [Planctomycetota bacterium]|jgi:hypothetical protein
MTMRILVTAAAAAAILFHGALLAEEGEQKAKRGEKRAAMKEERKAFHEGMKKARQEQRTANKENRKTFRESLKEMSPEQKIAAITAQMEKRYASRSEFAESQQEKRTSFAKELMAKYEVPAEKQTEILNRIESRYNEAKAHHAKQYEENKAFIKGIDPEADRKETRAQAKAHRESQRKENQAFRKSRHTGRKGGKK